MKVFYSTLKGAFLALGILGILATVFLFIATGITACMGAVEEEFEGKISQETERFGVETLGGTLVAAVISVLCFALSAVFGRLAK